MSGGYLPVHALDTARGVGADDLPIEVEPAEAGRWNRLKEVRTNASRQTDEPVLASGEVVPGTYRLTSDVGAYFPAHSVRSADPPYLSEVPIQATLAADVHHLVPFAISPWGYTHFRGG
jgi:5-hydroxyisourate hydrolase